MSQHASAKRFPAFAAVSATIVFWGFSYISTKTLLKSLTPFQVAAGRFLMASAVLLLIGLVSGKVRPIERRDWPRLLGSAFFGIFIYFICENSGLRLTTAGMGSLIIATIPVINVFVSSLFLGERSPLRSWAGVLLSIVGVFLVIRGGSNFGWSSLWGNLLVLGAAVSWVVYTLLNQPLCQKYDAFSLNIYQTLFGTVLLCCLALGEGTPLPRMTPNIVMNLIYLAVCCSALGYIFYNYALSKLGSTVVTTFVNFIPVCGVLGGILLLGEPFNLEQLIGGLVILGGVMLVSLGGKRFNNK